MLKETIKLLIGGPKEPEEILNEATKATQEKSYGIVKNNLDILQAYLSEPERAPTKFQMIQNSEKRLENLVAVIKSGQKPGLSLGYNAPVTRPLLLVLFLIRREIEAIFCDLGKYDIHISALKKGYYAREMYGYVAPSMWSEKEVRNLPFLWLNNVILYTHEMNGKNAQERNKVFEKLPTQEELTQAFGMLRSGTLPPVSDWYLDC